MNRTVLYLENRITIDVPTVQVEKIKKIIPPDIKIEGIKIDTDFFKKSADEMGRIVWRKV